MLYFTVHCVHACVLTFNVITELNVLILQTQKFVIFVHQSKFVENKKN
jgi:hypothetical protein